MFSPGHRIRFAATNAMWPMLWPTPHPMTTTLRVAAAAPAPAVASAADSNGAARFTLPVIPAAAMTAAASAGVADAASSGSGNGSTAATAAAGAGGSSTPPPSPAFLEPSPAVSPGLPGTWGALDGGNTSGYGEIDAIQRDAASGESYGVATNSTAQQYPWGTERFEEAIEHRTSDAEPAKTSVTGECTATVGSSSRRGQIAGSCTLRRRSTPRVESSR